MSIVEKMARAHANYVHGGSYDYDADYSQDEKEDYCDGMRAALTATGLTEAQLEGLANGTMVVVAARADLISWCNQWPYCGCKKNLSGLEVCEVSAMLAAKEG